MKASNRKVRTKSRIQVLVSLSVGASLVLMTLVGSSILAYGQVAPVFSPFHLHTDKYEYEFGETIVISGISGSLGPSWLKQEDDNLVLLQIFTPLLSLYKEEFVTVTPQGTFTYELKLEGKYAVTGEYRVVATYGDLQEQYSFMVAPCAMHVCTYYLYIKNSDGTTNTHPINYKIYGILKGMGLNSETNSLTVNVESIGNGRILIAIPSSVLEVTENGRRDANFTVILNGQQVNYEEVSDENFIVVSGFEIENPSGVRVIGIDFSGGAAQIEIVGTRAIPQFPLGSDLSLYGTITAEGCRTIQGTIMWNAIDLQNAQKIDLCRYEKNYFKIANCKSPAEGVDTWMDPYSGKRYFFGNACDSPQPFSEDWKIYMLNEDQMFKIPYKITNGMIKDIDVDLDFASLFIELSEPNNDGILEIAIPRNLIDAKTEDGLYDDDFIVFVDEEGDFQEVNTSPCFRTLSIKFSEGSEEIEIAGNDVMLPEQVITDLSPVYFTTDKIDYGMGDTIIVSGCTNLAFDDKRILVEVQNPEGKAFRTMYLIPNPDGSFATSIPVKGDLAVAGTYTVKATYAGYTYVPEFPVNLMVIITIVFMGVLIALRAKLKLIYDT